MNKFSKDQLKRRDELIAALRKEQVDLEAAIAKANEKIEEGRNGVQIVVDSYNEKLADLLEFRDELVNDMTSYIDDKSEKWQESEKGGTYTEWKDGIENTDLGGIEVDMPEDIEAPDMSHGDEAEAWPEAPE